MSSLYDTHIHSRYFPPTSIRRVPDRYAAICDAVKRARGNATLGQVLEIGVESVLIADYLRQELGIGVDAYDVVDVSTEVVRDLGSRGLRVVQRDVSAEILPYPDYRFSLVVMSEVLEHLPDPDYALGEIHRVLKPGGNLILTTPNLAAWFNRALLLIGAQPAFTETGTSWVFGRLGLLPQSRPVGHLQVLTFRSTLELLSHHGFRPTRIRGLPVDASLGLPWAASLADRFMAHLPSLASDLLVVATRG